MPIDFEMNFDDFVGNTKASNQIRLLSSDAAENDGPLPHLGFFGPAGHGKTTMARIVANHVGRKFVYINSVAVKNPMIFRGIITNPENNMHGAVTLLDECHRLPGAIQDTLLSVLEKPAMLVTSYRNQIIRDTLPDHMSFIFATTNIGKMRNALLSRLESIEFQDYSIEEMQLIAAKYLKKRHEIPAEAIEIGAIRDIGRRSRNGRHVVKICDNMIRYMKARNKGALTKDVSNKVFSIFDIDQNGLTSKEVKLLAYLAESGQCGLDTLEAYLDTPKKDIKDKFEPWLLRKNFIIRQASGRAITQRGMRALRGEIVDA